MNKNKKLNGSLIIDGASSGNMQGYAFGAMHEEPVPNKLPQIPVIFQAVISPYKKTDEGELIKTLSIPWKSIVNSLVCDPQLAFRIPPRRWEEIIAATFDAAGYDKVTLTPRSGDYGRDVIATKHGVGSIRIIDSVKAYKSIHPVRYEDVRSLLGVLFADPLATKAILSTTSFFAPRVHHDPLIQRHVPYRLELMDGESLIKWLHKTAKNI